MGIEIIGQKLRPLRDNLDPCPTLVLRNVQSGGDRTNIEVGTYEPQKKGNWPEIHLTMDGTQGHGTTDYVKKMTVRIHGVTVKQLLKELVKDEDIFAYLASAVDHLRQNPGQFDA